ncbi:MAG: response regulator [Treponema sp.]|jgi:CheY-like chemotaxis protein|nr:response regulator [Treponema sp.]
MTNKKVILAIDDNIQQLKLFQGILVPKYDLRIVKSASDAMNFIHTNTADLILLDIEMPNISGFEFLNDIKKVPSYMDVPVIIVSGNTGEAFLSKARNSSAVDVLTKPVLPDQLIETIEKHL